MVDTFKANVPLRNKNVYIVLEIHTLELNKLQRNQH